MSKKKDVLAAHREVVAVALEYLRNPDRWMKGDLFRWRTEDLRAKPATEVEEAPWRTWFERGDPTPFPQVQATPQCACLIGALYYATASQPASSLVRKLRPMFAHGESPPGFVPVPVELMLLVSTKLEDSLMQRPSELPEWNDRDERTHSEVIQVLESTLAAFDAGRFTVEVGAHGEAWLALDGQAPHQRDVVKSFGAEVLVEDLSRQERHPSFLDDGGDVPFVRRPESRVLPAVRGRALRHRAGRRGVRVPVLQLRLPRGHGHREHAHRRSPGDRLTRLTPCGRFSIYKESARARNKALQTNTAL